MSTPKINLSLLKQLVSELETALTLAENIRKDPDRPPTDYVIEMSKAVGLVMGVNLESSMLVGDFQTVMQNVTGASKQDNLKNLLSYLKDLKGGDKPPGSN